MRERQIRQVIRAILAESQEDRTLDIDRFRPSLSRLMRAAISEAAGLVDEEISELERIRDSGWQAGSWDSVLQEMERKISDAKLRSVNALATMLNLVCDKVLNHLVTDAVNVDLIDYEQDLDRLTDSVVGSVVRAILPQDIFSHLYRSEDEDNSDPDTVADALVMVRLSEVVDEYYNALRMTIDRDASASEDEIIDRAREGVDRIKSIKITVPSTTPGYMRTFGKNASYLATGIIWGKKT